MSRQTQLKTLHVVVGVITDDDDRVLIQQRSDGPFAGLWEYPGGKVEPAESVPDALARELFEELGLRVHGATPLINITHCYPDRTVTLDTHVIDRHDANVRGAEGQPIKWVSRAQLFHEAMLPADRPLTMAINLPHGHWTLTEEWRNATDGLGRLGERLARLRNEAQAPASSTVSPILVLPIDASQDAQWATAVALVCREHDVRLMLTGSPALAALAVKIGAAGVECPRSTLDKVHERPVSLDLLFAILPQNDEDVGLAQAIGADYAVLGGSPAASDRRSLAEVAAGASLPLYAPGSGDPEEVLAARRAGGQGIAARFSPD